MNGYCRVCNINAWDLQVYRRRRNLRTSRIELHDFRLREDGRILFSGDGGQSDEVLDRANEVVEGPDWRDAAGDVVGEEPWREGRCALCYDGDIIWSSMLVERWSVIYPV